MNSLRHLSDEILLAETNRLVREERERLTVILHHLREIERRRLYCGQSSLFTYVVNVLGYSEDQAYRRISAMRLLKDLPDLEEKITSGTINLSHIGLAQSVFRHEKKQGRAFTAEKKAALLEAIEGLPARQAQRAVLRFQPEAPPERDRITPVAEGRNLARIELSDETLFKIESVKSLLAHQDPDMSMDQLINRLCDLGLEHWDPARPIKRKMKGLSQAEVRRRVWQRDQGRCVKCSSSFALEIDHIQPVSMGGSSTLENLRLLCRTCNQRAAIEKLGHMIMDAYLSPAAPRELG